MRVVLFAQDKPNHLQTRLDNREAHVAFLKSSDIVEQAGPLLDSEGNMCGSMLVLEVESLEAAEQWASEDPYKQAGLFESVVIKPWNRVIGN